MTLDCSSDSSGDLYGLGVRIGIYCIWLTSYLANTFVTSEIAGSLDANAIFLLALIVTLFKGTAASGEAKLKYIDGLVLMHLCSGYIFGPGLSVWGYRTAVHTRNNRSVGMGIFGGFGTHFRLLLCATISVYGTWFWVKGIQNGLTWITDADGNKLDQCYPLVTFFFAKLPVMDGSPIRVYYIVMTVCSSLYFCSMLLVAMVSKALMLAKTGKLVVAEMQTYQTGLTQKELKYVFMFCRWGNLIWMIFAMLMTEMTLVWNHVDQVVAGGSIATPSQLLPLLVGVAGVVRILYIILREHKEKHRNSEAESNVIELVSSAHDEPDVDITTRPLWVRYLITLLPWLSLPHFALRSTRSTVAGVEEVSIGGHNTEVKQVPVVSGSYPKSAVVVATSGHSSRSSSSGGRSVRAK